MAKTIRPKKGTHLMITTGREVPNETLPFHKGALLRIGKRFFSVQINATIKPIGKI